MPLNQKPQSAQNIVLGKNKKDASVANKESVIINSDTEQLSANGKVSISSSIRKLVKTVSLGTILVIILVIVFTFANKPEVNISFKSYSGPSGYGAIWESVIDISGGRPSGINNLTLRFCFPTNITKIETVSDGSCEGIKISKDEMLSPKGFDWKKTEEKSGMIHVPKCFDGSKLVFRFQTSQSSFDDKLCPDTGSYEGKFNWTLPIINVNVPWDWLIPSSELHGEIPADEQETPYIATHGYPAGVSRPPYYNLLNRTGEIVSILDPRDFNERIGKDQTFISFSRPSTKIRIYSKKQGIVGAWIYWIHCKKPIVIEKKVEPMLDYEINRLLSKNLKCGIHLKWKECKLQFFFRPVKSN